MALLAMRPDAWPDLFSGDDPARARTSDPPTSHAAAARVNRTGAADADAQYLLGLVRTYPAHTIVELGAIAAGLDDEHRDPEWWRQKLGRRASGLRRANLIEFGPPRNGCRTLHPRYG